MRLSRRGFRLGRAAASLFLFIVAAVTLAPILLTFLYSFFPKGEISEYLKTRNRYADDMWMDVLYSPSVVSIRQYYSIMIEQPKYLQLFVNSAFYAFTILAGQAVVVPLTAYALSRFRFRGRDALFFCVLVLMLLPFQVTMAPSVMTLRALGLMNTVWAVILPMWFSPFYIFLVRQFMLGLPNELLEAGMMDGAGSFRGYLHITLPACRPILCASAALSFADSWNLVEQPLLYLASQPGKQPLSVLFNQISTENGDVAFAGAALYLLPALLVYWMFQDDILMGVQLSELK